MVKPNILQRLSVVEDQALPGAIDPTAIRESEKFEAEMANAPGWRAAQDVFKDDPPNQTLSERLSTPERVNAAKDIARLLSTHYTGRDE